MRPNREVIYRSMVAFGCFFVLAFAALLADIIGPGGNDTADCIYPLGPCFFLGFIYTVRATLLAWRHRLAVTPRTWAAVVFGYAPMVYLVLVGHFVSELLVIPALTALLAWFCIALRATALSAAPVGPDLHQEPCVGVDTPGAEPTDK